MKTILLLSLLVYSGKCDAQNYIDNYLSGTPTYTTIASSSNSVSLPRDLDFKPYTNELWVANRGGVNGSSMVIVYNAGQANQVTEYRKDTHSDHFMIYGSAIAFGDNGDWGSTGEIKNTNVPASTFMGPALWSSDTSVFARVFQNNWDPAKPLGSHLDMIHQSPFSMGIAHDSGNIYWVSDGHNGNLCKYDFGTDHSPGYDDHSNGKIWRYTDVPLTRQVNIPGHMVLDKGTGWLYIVDAGTKKLKRVNTKTGSISGTLSVPSTSVEALDGYWSVTGAQVQALDSFLTSQPSGVDVYNGRLIVSDYNTGDIHVYNIAGATPVKMGTIVTGQSGIMGVKIGTDGKIWFVNYTQNTVVRINAATVVNNDVAIEQITSPSINNAKADYYHPGFNQCAASVSPVVILKNYGANTLTTATITYQIDNGTPGTYAWAGNLATNASVSVALPSISSGDGSHKLIVTASNPNSTTDANPANNRKEGAFRSRTSVSNYPFRESFSSATFPPAGWAYIGHNVYNEMSHVPSVGSYGSNNGSIRMDHYSSYEDISGQRDYLILPRINLSSAPSGVGLGFAVAYAGFDPSSNDELAVMASTDCGNTWNQIFSKSGAALSTAPSTTVEYVPVDSEWRNEVIPLAAYAGQSNVMLMFVSTSNHGNNMFLDDINIASGLGVQQINADQVSIYPNPTSGKLNIELNNLPQSAQVSVFDVVGREIKTSNNAINASRIEIDLSDQPNGIYLIKVSAGGRNYQQKISVLK